MTVRTEGSQRPTEEVEMSPTEISRAWKDCAFRDSLTDDQRARLPAHPAGASAASGYQQTGDKMLAATHEVLTMGCCDGLTQSPGVCSWFCGSGGLGDTTYGCCTPGRTM
jgi:mersacidin/lichenicidin family type 2 lantibiotic